MREPVGAYVSAGEQSGRGLVALCESGTPKQILGDTNIFGSSDTSNSCATACDGKMLRPGCPHMSEWTHDSKYAALLQTLSHLILTSFTYEYLDDRAVPSVNLRSERPTKMKTMRCLRGSCLLQGHYGLILSYLVEPVARMWLERVPEQLPCAR